MIDTIEAECPLCGNGPPRIPIAHGPDFEYRTTGDEEFALVRCTGCRTILLDPRPADDAIPRLYPADYEPYRFDRLPPVVRAGRDLVQSNKVRLIDSLAPDGGAIVDVGCGAGNLLRLIRARSKRHPRLTGWDFPGEHLDRVRDAGFAVIAGSVVSELAPHDVDLFILNQVIEHFPRPREVLQVLTRALRPGGRILLETPDASALDARIFGERHWGGYHIPRHMVIFERQGIVRLLHDLGMEVESVDSLASPAFWIQSVHHALSESPLPSSVVRWFTIRNPVLLGVATAFDLLRAPFSATSNVRIVARRVN